MATRILRDGILTSERVAKLGWAEEVFYRRLMSVADDHGRYYALPALLRAACYPLHLDKVSDADIGKWLTACVNAALVSVYPASDGKRYLQILDFGQRIQSKSKFPEPAESRGEVPLKLVVNGDSQKSTVIHRESPEVTALVGVGVVVEEEQSTSLRSVDSQLAKIRELPDEDASEPDLLDDNGRRKRTLPPCPTQRIADLWDEVLPELRSPVLWTDKRRLAVSTRWREMAAHYRWTEQQQGLDWFRTLFTRIRGSPFLMGQVSPREKGRAPFRLDMDWLFRPTNWLKVIEGKFHEPR